ncbi:MAG: hypothetical protein J7L96_08415 [Bacteroidales bacterium]|nr:hypothetical protein [Bacteroidales bacterium]
MKRITTILLFAMAGLVGLIVACSRVEPVEPDPYVSLETDMLCKSRGVLKGEAPGAGESCVWWEYDGDSTLILKHLNAGFNCCPEKLFTDLAIKGDTIEITERDSLQLCRCNCFYDLDITVHHVKSQKFIVHFVEPFVTGLKDPLIFQIDLENQSSGKACQDRDYYPWGK